MKAKKRVTNADLLAEIQRLSRRVDELEKMAHPQGVLVDPELTEAIKRIAERPYEPPSPYSVPYTVPWGTGSPYRWPAVPIC